MNKHSAWLRAEKQRAVANCNYEQACGLRDAADALDALLAACITAREKLEMIKRGGVTWYLDVELHQLDAAIQLAEGEQA